jgi:predicted adenine nucleotide alpha hydrolase (AANH) superfamily ATPase
MVARYNPPMKRLLLHVCCAPCSTLSHRRLAAEGWDVTLLFYNPNLHPVEEHDRRLEEARRYASEACLPLLAPDADFAGWDEATHGLGDAPEGGERCEVCFAFRLEAVAKKAREGGFDAFASTLSISPHKKAERIDRAGAVGAERHGVDYLATDFKKRGGFQESVRLSGEHGLYRQTYCGCRYSRREREVQP